MNIDHASQIVITVFGGLGLWLSVGARTEGVRRWGVIAGLIAQPAWYVQMVVHGQWLMLPVYTMYTGAWLRGLWVHWIRPASPLAGEGEG